MIRIAAVGDVHVGADCVGCLGLDGVRGRADLLLLAGDLTRVGECAEAEILCGELATVDIPVITVLGNHDYHSNSQEAIVACLESCGITVLEGEAAVVEVKGTTVGVVGAKGFGGGFAGACGSDFGEAEMKAFIRHTKGIASRLEERLRQLVSDVRVVLLHYAPIDGTLHGEREQIYPFLGSYLLGEAIDAAGADVVFHGHAHHGTEKGVTPGGIRVRNVAKPVIGRSFNIYELPEAGRSAELATSVAV